MANIPVYQQLVDGQWVEVSEEDFMSAVYKHHNKATPIIRKMLAGELFLDGDTTYRLVIITN